LERSQWFEPKWRWLKRFALAGAGGVVLVAVAALTELHAVAAIGVLFFVPLIFWVAFIPVLHWKDRYIGSSGNIWGAFLVFETSSWSKLFYWLRHVLPDWRRSGVYADAP
jgi:hypothetical protein